MIGRYQSKTKGVRFYARIHVGAGKYRYGRYRATELEAMQDEVDLRRGRNPSTVPTVNELCDWWLRVYPERDRRRTGEPPRGSTISTANHAVRPFKAQFGASPVDELSMESLKKFAAEKKWAVPQISTMFSDAIEAEKIKANPVKGLIQKRKKRKRPRDEFITESELDRICEIAHEVEPKYPILGELLRLLGWTGVRQSEAFMLTRGDVNGEVLHVRWTLGSTGEVTTPKNHNTRSIFLPPAAADAIKSLPTRIDTDLIFLNKDGRRLTRPAFYQHWKPVKVAFLRELPDSRARQLHNPPEVKFVPHSMRHFCATYLLDQGVTTADVAYQLGTTEKEIVDTYGHPSDVARRDRLSRAFDRNVVTMRDVSAESQR